MHFTVITPCYNGSRFLSRAHESLLRNLNKEVELEWIIVDDYSNDEGKTKEAIELICSNSPIKIKTIFLSKNYYGSQSTYTGAKVAKGQYTIILDQDDMLADGALNIFKKHIKAHENTKNFAGVCGRCVDLSGKMIGTPFLSPSILSNELEIRHKYRIHGEMFQCTKTSLLIEYFKGMQPGHTNGWAWSRIAQKYNYVYTSEIVRIYDTTNPESTSNKKQIKYIDAQLSQLNEYFHLNCKYAIYDKKYFFKLLTQIIRLSLHKKNVSPKKILYGRPLITWALFPPAYLAGKIKYLIDTERDKNNE